MRSDKNSHGDNYMNIECRITANKRPTDLGIKNDFLSTGRFGADSDTQAKNVDKLIKEIGLLAADFLPFSTVKNPRFQHLLAVAEARYKIKSEKY